MLRDVNFYRFLKGAITYKYKNAQALDFHTIKYDPWIYKWARETFRELKAPEFLNIQNKDVLKRLYEQLHIDPRLKPLDNPDLALAQKEYELSEKFHQQLETDKTLAQQVTSAPVGAQTPGESTKTMAETGGKGIHLPSAPTSAAPAIHSIPQTKPPIPEEGPATAKRRRFEEANPATAKMERLQEQAKAFNATQPAPATAKVEPLRSAATNPGLKFRSGFGSNLRTFGSKAGTFFKTNSGRVASGLGEIFKRLGRNIAGPGLTGLYNTGVKLGGGGINALASVSNQIARGRAAAQGISKSVGQFKGKFALAGIFLGFFLFALVSAIGTAIPGATSTGEAAPVPGGNVGISPPAPPVVTPPSVATDCPIPNGRISCGSQFTPINGCGHCGVGYPPESTNAYCGWSGTKYAIDVEGDDLQSLILPKIRGNTISWTFQREERGSLEAIQQYTGGVSVNGAYQTYFLQFHHTQPGSGNPGTHQSGAVGGRICGGGCNERHTHIQIGSGGDHAGGTAWLDAAQYFCKQ